MCEDSPPKQEEMIPAMPPVRHTPFRTAVRTGGAILAVVLLAACEPLWVIPGGALGGDESAPPGDWSFTDAVDTVQVETRPADPYSVNVWGVTVGRYFYVAASRGGESPWARAMDEDGLVRLRVGGAVYPLRASRVVDEAELGAVSEAYVRKYEVDDDNFVGAAWVFRLGAGDD